MSAQKPATPLPWEAGPWIYSMHDAVYCNVAAGPDRVASVSVHGRLRDSDVHTSKRKSKGSYTGKLTKAACDKDAAYLCHAANAYPKLVEALRACVAAASADVVEDMSAVSNASDEASDLLRELGEES